MPAKSDVRDVVRNFHPLNRFPSIAPATLGIAIAQHGNGYAVVEAPDKQTALKVVIEQFKAPSGRAEAADSEAASGKAAWLSRAWSEGDGPVPIPSFGAKPRVAGL